MSKQGRQNITMFSALQLLATFWHKKPRRLGGKNNLINLLLFLSTSDSGYNQSQEIQLAIVYHLPRIRKKKTFRLKNIRIGIEERWRKTSQKIIIDYHLKSKAVEGVVIPDLIFHLI